MNLNKNKQQIELPNPNGSAAKSSTPDLPFALHFVRFGFQTLGRLFPNKAAQIAYKLFATPRIRAKHRVSDALLEQAKVFEILYGKYLLKGYEWGSGDKIILLAHGWESRGTAMRSFVPMLLEKGYRIVAMDGPAHGNSSGKRTNLPEFSGAVLAFLQRLGKVHGIIGHSFGGSTTMYALGHLDHSIAIKKLVLVGVAPQIENIWRKTAKQLHLPSIVTEKFKNILEGIAGKSFAEMDDPSYKQNIKVDDVLVVHDRFDPIVPFAAGEHSYEAFPQANMLITNHLGHFHLMKNPEVIAHIVDFLEEE